MVAGNQSETGSSQNNAEARATPHVLVVEDELTVADITCRMVRDAGYSCEWVRTGIEAIALVEAASFSADLLLVDIVLPDISGIQVARQFAQHRPGAPILFISAYPEYRLEPPVIERGRFLPKPYSGAELAEVLHDLLPLPTGRTAAS